MTDSHPLSQVWLKASILGSTWAASEIILGSFLHNLRIPFNGNILTAIGFILLIAASYRWPDKGLFWRSGLLCALMKTISPSAVIFGPMVAIFAEALLLEISVRILGRNLAGFILGSALAMSWILFQKIFNFILFYGFHLVDIYTNLMKYAEKQLHTNFNLVWAPVLILLLAYIVFGIFAVIIGIKIGRSLTTANRDSGLKKAGYNFGFNRQKNADFPYSVAWLIADFIIMAGMLLVINLTPVFVWIPLTILVVVIWTKRYKRGMRQLSKPSFWIWFVALTMLSAFAVTAIQGVENKWIEGLITGLQMNFRAAIVILGFTVLGTELYNPKIRSFFARTAYHQLPVALEMAFDTLPGVISSLPEVKSFFTQPAAVIRTLIFRAEARLAELEIKSAAPLFFLTGNLAGGKTTFASQLIDILKDRNISTGGFISPRVMDEGNTIAYNLQNITGGETIPFLTLASGANSDIGKFSAIPQSIEKAGIWVHNDINSGCKLIVLDEIGNWELKGGGWHPLIIELVSKHKIPMLWVVRQDFTNQIKSFYSQNQAIEIYIDQTTVAQAAEVIIRALNASN